MTKHIPHIDSAAYRAAALIHKVGPMSRAELFDKVHFSERQCNSSNMLRMTISNGWLAEQSGVIALTDISRVHFDGLAGEVPAYIGKIATPRISSAMTSPELGKKYKPNAQGNRNDIAVFSIRFGVRCYSVGGGAL